MVIRFLYLFSLILRMCVCVCVIITLNVMEKMLTPNMGSTLVQDSFLVCFSDELH